MRRRYVVTLSPQEVLDHLRERPELARKKTFALEPVRPPSRWRIRFTRNRPPFEMWEWAPQQLKLKLTTTPQGDTQVDAHVVSRPSPSGIGLWVVVEPFNFGGGLIATAIDAGGIMQRRRDERGQLMALVAAICVPHEVETDRGAFRTRARG